MTSTLPDAAALHAELLPLNAGERLKALHAHFGEGLVASTSFGLQSAVMLDLIARHTPDVPVVFIDTGYHFPETYLYAEELVARFGTDLRIYHPRYSAARMEALHGRLWEQGKEGMDRYGIITKVEPMDRALRELGATAWISGLRRSQSSTRSGRQLAELQNRMTKVYPILDWADAQVASYMYDHSLPPHPLEAQGYVTMGDWHTTLPVTQADDAESTRFNGQKYECGLHLESGISDFQI